MNFFQLGIGVLLLTVQACSNTTKENYKVFTHLKDPQIQKIMVNNSEITVKYLPKGDKVIEVRKRGVNSSESNYDMFLYFEVNINKKNLSIGDLNTANYLNFYIQNDFKLVNNTDTLIPALCQKINDGIKDNNKYIVVFQKPAPLSNNFFFIYDDKLFGVGRQKFLYDLDEFKKLPV